MLELEVLATVAEDFKDVAVPEHDALDLWEKWPEAAGDTLRGLGDLGGTRVEASEDDLLLPSFDSRFFQLSSGMA